MYHARSTPNPATGEVEDTDVGFPGPEHHIAEGGGRWRSRWAQLAVCAIVGGLLQIPRRDRLSHHFLEPTFADSNCYDELEPSDGLTMSAC